jgi:threonylcarbamoyladenosine tRNA methylthiotransferase MtaB
MRVTFATLGCKVNQVDTAHLEASFAARQYEVVRWPGPADVCVINTCTVTAVADRQSRQMVKRARRANPEALVIVTGCGPLSGGGMEDAFAEADLITGNVEKSDLPRLAAQWRRGATRRVIGDIAAQTEVAASGAALIAGRARSFLKVQDGCPAACSYCVVPQVRGPSRSAPPQEVLVAVRDLLRLGTGEIVLTGIHLGAYGADLRPATNLAALCRDILRETATPRLRLSSVEPQEVSGELVDLMAGDARLCNHLHLPLQSGSDRILQMMNRSYRVAEYESIVAMCRNRIADITIGADVLVGFPGEDDEAFAETLATLRRLRLPHLHVFPYSDRPGTAASRLPEKVPSATVRERAAQVRALAAEFQREHRRAQIGKRLLVLVEQITRDGLRRGASRNYLPVLFASNAGVGEEIEVLIELINEKCELVGR